MQLLSKLLSFVLVEFSWLRLQTSSKLVSGLCQSYRCGFVGVDNNTCTCSFFIDTNAIK